MVPTVTLRTLATGIEMSIPTTPRTWSPSQNRDHNGDWVKIYDLGHHHREDEGCVDHLSDKVNRD